VQSFPFHYYFVSLQKIVHHRTSSLKFSVGLVVVCHYKKLNVISPEGNNNFRKPCVIVSWNVKFQESNEWKSKVGKVSVTRDDDCYNSDEDDSDEDDSDDDEWEEDDSDEEVPDEEDSEYEEVHEDEAYSRTKNDIPGQDQPHYHILMVDSDEANPQFQLNVPEGNQ
jgi:F-box protein 21